MTGPLILDFDASVKPLTAGNIVSLGHLQETIRFGCRRRTLRNLARKLAPVLEHRPPVVFLGSGDFHHVSYLLIQAAVRAGTRIQVVVFDNHPDNMRYPFGIHCGSWVWHVSRLPFVERVHVVGITSTDVETGHVWENHLGPLYSGRVTYYCLKRDLRTMRRLGIRHGLSFPSMASLFDRLHSELRTGPDPVYLSVDKDVLARDVVQTNWDQGVMRMEELTAAIRALRPRLIGSDVVGDVSIYRYRSLFKRMLSGFDNQPDIPAEMLNAWQERHRQVNLQLLSLLAP